MSNRLLTLLTQIERAVVANDPSPGGGTWDTLRLVNFHQGLARLTFSIRSMTGATSTQGVVLLQDFTLADGTQCVKANLSWQGIEKSALYSIYSKPLLDWNREAAQIGAQWLDGHSAAMEAKALAVDGSDGSLMSATG
ncbi:MAG TPA: hypothetical protein VGM64_07275 [Lacunisphaera sp.]|jgi:hypothetical protein